jgi:hypothetical protein
MRNSCLTATPKEYGLAEQILWFKCKKCGWWAAGTYQSDNPATREELADVQFDVRCMADDCGWSGQLKGSDAHQTRQGSGEIGLPRREGESHER